MKVENLLVKRILCGVFAVGGIVCIGVALGFPVAAPILVPVGTVCLAGILGMFQGGLASVSHGEEGEQCQDINQGANTCDNQKLNGYSPSANQLNMMFIYNNRNHEAPSTPYPSRESSPRSVIRLV